MTGDNQLSATHPDSLRTRLTERFGVEYPFVGAGMGFVSTPPLCAAVSNAGGIGFLGVGPERPEGLVRMIRATRELTERPFGVDFVNDTCAFGPMTTDEHIEACAAERVRVVAF